MTDSWPKCITSIEMFGQKMVCDLPKGHAMDGERRHHDPEKGMWLLTAKYEDGREIVL